MYKPKQLLQSSKDFSKGWISSKNAKSVCLLICFVIWRHFTIKIFRSMLRLHQDLADLMVWNIGLWDRWRRVRGYTSIQDIRSEILDREHRHRRRWGSPTFISSSKLFSRGLFWLVVSIPTVCSWLEIAVRVSLLTWLLLLTRGNSELWYIFQAMEFKIMFDFVMDKSNGIRKFLLI